MYGSGKDNLVDELTDRLTRLPPETLRRLLPEGMDQVGLLFPVVRRLERHMLHRLPSRTHGSLEPLQVRREAVAALRTLLGRLARRSSLLLFVDDLHWGDADSAHLLLELLSPPDAPPLLFMGCMRPESGVRSPFLSAFLEPCKRLLGDRMEVLTLGPLAAGDARSLAASQLRVSEESKLASRVVQEAGGNPYFIGALAWHQRGGQGASIGEVPEVRLEQVIEHHIRQLPDGAGVLLEVIAIAGRPIPEALAITASGLPEGRDLMDRLHAESMIRRAGVDLVEPFHDLIRATLIAGLDGEATRRHHLKLAGAMEDHGSAVPEELAQHYEAAGATSAAARYARLAARRPRQHPALRGARQRRAGPADRAMAQPQGVRPAPVVLEPARGVLATREGAARLGEGDRRLLRPILKDIRRVSRTRVGWREPLARLLEAGAAALVGDEDRSRRILQQAEQLAGELTIPLLANIARLRRGQVTQDQALMDEAAIWLRSRTITNPARFAEMLAPGFPPIACPPAGAAGT